MKVNIEIPVIVFTIQLLSFSSSTIVSLKQRSNLIQSSSGSNGFRFTQKNSGGGLRLVGDVNHVLQGHVTNATVDTHWSAEGVIGFGAGAIGSLAGTGEGFLANGFAFVRQTDNSTHDYYQTVSNNTLRTQFSMFVSQDFSPDGIAEVSQQNGIQNPPRLTFLDFYTQVYNSVDGSPFCLYGLADFHQMDAIAISKAPIYGEPLFGDIADGYYTQPPFAVPGAYGLVFGCTANFSRVSDPVLLAKLSKALYVNPLDEGSTSALQVHTHVLTLSRCVTDVRQITPCSALDVYHLLSTATIKSISASVFKIDTADKLEEIFG